MKNTKNRTSAKVGKFIASMFLGQVWLIAGAVFLLSLVAGWVAGRGIICWALRIIIGMLLLYGIISGNWDGSLILGIPAVFLYILPNISEGVCNGCLNIMGAISDYIHRPVTT